MRSVPLGVTCCLGRADGLESGCGISEGGKKQGILAIAYVQGAGKGTGPQQEAEKEET